MESWFVLYCKPRMDEVAEINLLQQEYMVYRPCITLTRQRKWGNTTLVKESLFPRYLFLKINSDKKSLTPATYTRGVVGFVQFNNKYSVVSNEIIDSIKQCELRNQRNSDKTSLFKPGERIFINGAGFHDFGAIFLENCSDTRTIVLLNILGRSSKVKVPIGVITRKSIYQ